MLFLNFLFPFLNLYTIIMLIKVFSINPLVPNQTNYNYKPFIMIIIIFILNDLFHPYII